jgi:hypothetical protein
LERAIGVACLRRGRQVALIVTVFWLLVTSPVITSIVVPTATSLVAAVVIVAP